jgi:energy-coupling factor transport system permease protein
MGVNPSLLDARSRPWLGTADPRLKLVGLVWFSTLSILVDSTAALTALFALAVALALGVKLRPAGWLAVTCILGLIAWGTLVGQALFYEAAPRTVLATIIPAGEVGGWHFPGLRLYREGAVHGLAQSLRMLTMMLAGLAVALSTSPERLLAALARWRLNAAVGFVAVTALRFVPILAAEWATVRQARRLRGYRPRLVQPGPWARRWGQAAALEFSSLMPVLSASLRRANALAVSVTARGFDPTGRRTFYPPLRFRTRERLLLALLIASGLVLLAAKALFWLYQAELYYHPALRGMYDLVRVWL